jgi:hypothetical protein
MWLSKISEVFIAQHAIDFRKGADGLIAECYAMELDPYRGECVVFVHRSRRMVKVIGGDAYGVWVLLRRFEGGALREMFPFLSDPSFVSATQGELALLLEGATCELKAKAIPWKIDRQSDNGYGTVLRSQEYGKETQKRNEKTFTARATGRIREGASLGA